jgi:glycosyltransferase involved in cell wall biosynthesis
MRVVDVSFVYDETLEIPAQQLKQHYTSVGWAEALQRNGAEVFCVKRFSKQTEFEENKVQYYFIKDRFKGHLKNSQLPLKVLKKVASLNPDIVLLHHLSLSFSTVLIRLLLKRKTGIIVQHHGGPYGKGIKKIIHDILNSVADGYFFTTFEQGRQWFGNKQFYRKIMPVMEGSTFFDFERRIEKQEPTKRKESTNDAPAFLWVGRFDVNKDPLTVLNGVEVLFRENPQATMKMIFNSGQVVERVREKINSSEILKSNVQLLGEVRHETISDYYRNADYFVLGSHYEGSGYALSEALRCGCVPIVTNIPSFRMMTNNGKLGALWEPGNKDSLVEAAKLAMSRPLQQQAEACIDFFKNNLSFDAIAKVAMGYYQQLIDKRNRK